MSNSSKGNSSDEYDVGNSALGICTASKSGRRKSGVDDAVAWITAYPGIDGYTAAWLHAGGKLVVDQGRYHFSGLPFSADFNANEHNNSRFAQVLKMQVRMQEAAKRGLIEETERLIDRQVKAVDRKGFAFVRDIQSVAYKLSGSGDVNLADLGGNTGAITATQSDIDDKEAAPAQGMPKGFMDFLYS